MSAKKDKADAVSTNGKPSDSHDMEECFIIMPISDPDGYEEGHFGQVFDDLFAPACESAGYRAIRADQVRQTNLIHLDVLQKIVESPMALCDLSNRNPNVMFELGLRQAFDKPVVLVQEIGTPSIFDITPLRYTEYHREMLYRHVLEDQEKITNAITATKEAISNKKSVNSIVRLLSLTAASLTNISEDDKDTALLQVILNELGNLKSEMKSMVRVGSRTSSVPKNSKGTLSLKAAIAKGGLELYGLVGFLENAGVERSIIQKGLIESHSVAEFLGYISAITRDSSTASISTSALYEVEIEDLRAAFFIARQAALADERDS
jgi:hypothetical protein